MAKDGLSGARQAGFDSSAELAALQHVMRDHHAWSVRTFLKEGVLRAYFTPAQRRALARLEREAVTHNVVHQTRFAELVTEEQNRDEAAQ